MITARKGAMLIRAPEYYLNLKNLGTYPLTVLKLVIYANCAKPDSLITLCMRLYFFSYLDRKQHFTNSTGYEKRGLDIKYDET